MRTVFRRIFEALQSRNTARKRGVLYIDDFLSAAVTPQASLLLLRRLRPLEVRFLQRKSFRTPYFFWKSQMPEEARQQARRVFEGLAHEDLTAQDFLILAAAAHRLAPKTDSFSAYEAYDWSWEIETIPADLLEELCVMLHASGDFTLLRKISRQILELRQLGKRARHLLCDFYFQASYQRLKQKIFKNTLAASDVEELKADLSFCEERLGANNPNCRAYAGVLAAVEGDLRRAIELHAGQRTRGYHTQFFSAAANCLPLDELRRIAEMPAEKTPTPPAFFHKIHEHIRHETGAGDAAGVTLLSCDKGYFEDYFQTFAESFALLNPGGLIHLHMIAHRPDAAALNIMEDALNIRINWSCDPGPGDGVSPDLWRGYCAGARYMHLPRYLARYNRLVINDIDGVVHRSMADVWHGREDKIMLSTRIFEPERRHHFAVWSNIGAGAFGITGAPSHLRFAEAISRYVVLRFGQCAGSGERFFFSDQVGLLSAALNFEGVLEMVQMPQIFSQSSHHGVLGRWRSKEADQKKLLAKLKSG